MHKNIKSHINGLLSGIKGEVRSLLGKRGRLKDVEEIKNIDQIIDEAVDEANSLVINSRKIKAPELGLGSFDCIDDFKKTKSYLKYKAEAEHILLSGKYVPQFLFAGSATRFGMGSMWNVDLSAIGDVVLGDYASAGKYISKNNIGKLLVTLNNYSTALKFTGKNEINRFRISNPNILDFDYISKAYRKLKKYRASAAPVHIGMGPRQLIQYRLKLEKLAAKYRASKSEALSCQHLILNLNNEIFTQAKRDLIKNDFYGFNPEKIYILVQPVYHGHKISGSSLVLDKKSELLPFGHGHATMQLLSAGEAVKLNRSGKVSRLKNSVVNQLQAENCEIMGAHRINDMTKWTEDVVNIDNLAYSLQQVREKKKEVVIELVENPNNQKGGHWLKCGKKEFLAETLSTNSPDLKAFINSLDKVPYNAFRNMYSIKALASKLSGALGIKFNLRYKDARFYLEAVTGDITLIMHSAAFSRKGEIIHDIKNMVNYASEGIDFSCRQEINWNKSK